LRQLRRVLRDVTNRPRRRLLHRRVELFQARDQRLQRARVHHRLRELRRMLRHGPQHKRRRLFVKPLKKEKDRSGGEQPRTIETMVASANVRFGRTRSTRAAGGFRCRQRPPPGLHCNSPTAPTPTPPSAGCSARCPAATAATTASRRRCSSPRCFAAASPPRQSPGRT
jgi:hypothetical protein